MEGFSKYRDYTRKMRKRKEVNTGKNMREETTISRIEELIRVLCM